MQQNFNILLDRFLEISNHYQGELLENIQTLKSVPSRLSLLITSLENTDFDNKVTINIASEAEIKGQNIVPTADTLAALKEYRKSILQRLEKPENHVPRNIAILKKWLQLDVIESVSIFPSFTLAWDKLVEVSRLTLVPDTRVLQVRDNVYMAAVEFEWYIDSLYLLVMGKRNKKKITAKMRELASRLKNDVDPNVETKLEKISRLLENPTKSIEDEDHKLPGRTALESAQATVDTLTLIGFELGFFFWLESGEGREHRKNVIKSLIYYSKILLEEKSWRRADEFASFAIRLIHHANTKYDFPPDEGTAMFMCNRFWARFKLGDDIRPDVELWDQTNLHPRYTFLKFVLLRQYGDAIRILSTLLPDKKAGTVGNLSMFEVNEWPILEDFRQSEQLKKFSENLGHGY